jgi:hypothetical protein
MVEFEALLKVDNKTLRYYIDAAFKWCAPGRDLQTTALKPLGCRRRG